MPTKINCPRCGGDGRVETGPPLGTCDGPQYGECPECRGARLVDASGVAVTIVMPRDVFEKARHDLDRLVRKYPVTGTRTEET